MDDVNLNKMMMMMRVMEVELCKGLINVSSNLDLVNYLIFDKEMVNMESNKSFIVMIKFGDTDQIIRDEGLIDTSE